MLYKSDTLLALSKTAGLPVHYRRGFFPRGTRVMTDIVKEMLGVNVVFPAHRIDVPTSGVVIFSLDSETANKMCTVIQDKETTVKEYLVLCRGEDLPDSWYYSALIGNSNY